MFTVYHFLWLGICAIGLALCIWALKRYRPGLEKVLTIACAVSVCSELIKTFSMVQLVPSADGSYIYPYIELQHLPFHLCSIQILFIFYARFAKPGPVRTALLAFMYPSCLIGPVCALALPSIFSTSIQASQAFTHPLAYQFFVFHSMLIALGAYIPMCGEVEIRSKHYLSSLAILGLLGFLSLYLNSAFASPVYVNGELRSVEYVTNFFFTYKTPIGIALTEPWHWYVYMGLLIVLAVILIGLFFLPFFLRERKAAVDQ